MMRKNKPNSFNIRLESEQKRHAFNQKKDIQQYVSFERLEAINLFEWFKTLLFKINKLFIYFKYKLLKHSFGLFETNQVPWFKLGFIVLALFVLFKKDMQFSVNMKAPQEVLNQQEMENGKAIKTANYEAFGMNPTLAVLNDKNKKTAIHTNKAKRAYVAVDIEEEQVIKYVKRFSKTARQEMERYGIPASIKLAQGILESRANQHPTTGKTNNHFGQPMSAQPYQNAWENWRAHSLFLTNSGFRRLLTYQKEVDKWAEGLQALGYSTDKDYAQKLLWLIMQYDLTHFDA